MIRHVGLGGLDRNSGNGVLMPSDACRTSPSPSIGLIHYQFPLRTVNRVETQQINIHARSHPTSPLVGDPVSSAIPHLGSSQFVRSSSEIILYGNTFPKISGRITVIAPWESFEFPAARRANRAIFKGPMRFLKSGTCFAADQIPVIRKALPDSSSRRSVTSGPHSCAILARVPSKSLWRFAVRSAARRAA